LSSSRSIAAFFLLGGSEHSSHLAAAGRYRDEADVAIDVLEESITIVEKNA